MKSVKIFTFCTSLALATSGCASTKIDEEVNSSLKQNVEENQKLGTEYKKRLPDVLDLNKAYDIAIKNSPSLEIIRKRVTSAEALLKEAYSSYYPQISVGAGATRFNRVPNNQSFNGLIGDREVYDLSINAYWLVFDGFTRENRVLSKKYDLYTTEQQLEETQRLLLLSISQIFLATANAGKQMEISKAEELLSRDFLKQEQLKEEEGVSNKISVNNFKLRVNNSAISYIKSARDYKVGMVVLMELLGLSYENTSKLSLQVSSTEKVKLPSLGNCITQASLERPELKIIESQIGSSDAVKETVKGEYYPQVYLNGSYGGSAVDDFNYANEDESAYLGVYMNWNIFNGFSTTSRVNAQEAVTQSLIAERDRVRDRIISDVKRTYESINFVDKRLVYELNNTLLNKEIYEQTREQYNQGLVNITRVNEVLTDYFVAERAHTLAKIELLTLIEQLYAAMGTINDTTE